MSEILQSEESVKLYEYEIYKPDLEDYIQHFNHNHDPRNGQFTTGPGGAVSGGSGDIKGKKKKKGIVAAIKQHKLKKKRKESLAKARETKKANSEKRKAEEASKEQIEKMREEAIKKNDILTMYKNADKFSRSEIEEALNRKGTLDRLANEAAKMTPAPSPKKESTGRKLGRMAKESVKKGASDFARSTLQDVTRNALQMTLQEMAVRGAGGKKTVFSELSPDEKRAMVLKLFRSKK